MRNIEKVLTEIASALGHVALSALPTRHAFALQVSRYAGRAVQSKQRRWRGRGERHALNHALNAHHLSVKVLEGNHVNVP
jgi:hypothetical protein